MANDDDILTGPVPAPDAEPSAAERAHAKTFADLVDKAVAGRMPAAMSTDDRALLEVATVIRAAHGTATLAPAKQRSIVEDALRLAVGEPGASLPGVIPIAAAKRRWLPWTIAGASSLVAAAAVAVLAIRTTPTAPLAARPPATWTSRTADTLIGPIPRERAGDASARIDTIFADRLDGYRERRLSRGGTR